MAKEKLCSKCKKTKLLDEFRKHDRYTDGYKSWCKECDSEYQKEYWKTYYKPKKPIETKIPAEPEPVPELKELDLRKEKTEIIHVDQYDRRILLHVLSLPDFEGSPEILFQAYRWKILSKSRNKLNKEISLDLQVIDKLTQQ
jgi:hypothetical protein